MQIKELKLFWPVNAVNHFIREKIPSFWIYQTIGWLIYILHYVLFGFVLRIDFRYISMLILILFGLTLLLRRLYQFIFARKISVFWLLAVIAVISIICGVLSGIIARIVTIYLRQGVWVSLRLFLNSRTIVTSFSQIIVLMLWSGLYFLVKYWIEWRHQREMAAQAETAAQESQLEMLRYQLNPHFLFNALNSLRGLIHEDRHNAKLMLTDLSDYLRFSLMSRHTSRIPLGQEIEALRFYFAIEKRRYEERLQVDFDIDPASLDFQIIGFLLHPLAENAIKYGMRTSPMPLKILIKTMLQNGNLIIEITNTGRWHQDSGIDYSGHQGTGTGMQNIRSRLHNAFPDRCRLGITKNEHHVTIRIEIRSNKETHP